MVHCFLQTWQEKIGTSETYLSLCTFSFEVVITVLLTFLSFGTSSTVVYDKSSWKRKKVCRTLSSFEINCKLNVKYCAQHRAVSNSKARIDNGLKLQQSCFQNLRQGVSKSDHSKWLETLTSFSFSSDSASVAGSGVFLGLRQP